MNNLPPEAWVAINTAFNVIGTIGTALIGFFVILQNRRINQNNITSQENQMVLKDVQDKVNGRAIEDVAKAEEKGRRYTPPRVLVIDDDKNDMEFAVIELKKFQCHVFEAHTAKQADQLLMENIGPGRGYPFDFVLLDLKMPGGDSEQVIKLFDEKASRVPVIILTGQPEVGASMNLGKPRTWVTKPLSESDVRDLLDKHNIPYIDPSTKEFDTAHV